MGSREKDGDLQRLIPLQGLRLAETNGDSRSSSPADSPQGAPSSARQSGKEVLRFSIKCQGSNAFKEVGIIKHPSVGEYALGFITSTLVLRKNLGGEELCCVYVPTNHLYMGDIVLVNSKDIMRPNISIREEIVISGGMSIPKILTTTNSQNRLSSRTEKYVIPQV
ncbi:hypothetical protein L1987_51456 [Smallanthus sonchifolius]|uniref:Uncharacterized protein n=1 Tax=Smallanthus sonchifolius TaxID=185202 RepID=A0ACB9EQN6_9ASTR|nr:hypothetical protein L1987_51456 [Smallanthus sonchifolius]